MDPERARDLLAAERERIERALASLGHMDDGEEADEFDPANVATAKKFVAAGKGVSRQPPPRVAVRLALREAPWT